MTATTEQGIRISCDGDIKVCGSKKFFPVNVATNDPVFDDTMIGGGPTYEKGPTPSSPVSPISKLVGLPIQVRKIAPDPAWKNHYQTGYYNNQDATFLLVNLDPSSEMSGWAPSYWQSQVGSVLVSTVGSYDITPQQVEALSAYAYDLATEELVDAKEFAAYHADDGVEGDYEKRREVETKNVIDKITPTSFEKFYAEFKAKKVKEDPTWDKVMESVTMASVGHAWDTFEYPKPLESGLAAVMKVLEGKT